MSEFVAEPLGGLLFWFLLIAALPAIAAGFIVIGYLDHLFNVYGVLGYLVMVVVAFMTQTLLYGLLGEFLNRIPRKHARALRELFPISPSPGTRGRWYMVYRGEEGTCREMGCTVFLEPMGADPPIGVSTPL